MREFVFAFSVLLTTYGIVYPAIYFGWNYLVVQLGIPQYSIPGFWVGMLGYFMLNIFRNFVRGFYK